MHIAQAGFIKTIIDHLERSGSSVESIINRSGLKNFRLDDAEAYIPTDLMYKFLNNLRGIEGMSDFMEVFSVDIELKAISQWGERILLAPDLLSACKLAVANDKVMLTNETISLRISGHKAILQISYDDGPVRGRELHECINLAGAINGIKLAGGKKFAPMELHLQQESIPNLENLLPADCNTKIFTSQPATELVFDSSLLYLPLFIPGQNDASLAFQPDAPSSYSRKCERIIDAARGGYMPGIEEFACMASVSESTLRRRLAEEGTTYFEIIDNWRLKKALKLIQSPNFSLKEVSEFLSYSNVPNFERAFKRWTNTTPGVFRDQSHGA